jgi:hypothetical protein
MIAPFETNGHNLPSKARRLRVFWYPGFRINLLTAVFPSHTRQ